ncbi:unnamed protein product [Tilletia controversa]|nr:unnamed protein product [Tilletia controversa]
MRRVSTGDGLSNRTVLFWIPSREERQRAGDCQWMHRVVNVVFERRLFSFRPDSIPTIGISRCVSNSGSLDDGSEGHAAHATYAIS